LIARWLNRKRRELVNWVYARWTTVEVRRNGRTVKALLCLETYIRPLCIYLKFTD
jgi:hypothetical protein